MGVCGHVLRLLAAAVYPGTAPQLLTAASLDIEYAEVAAAVTRLMHGRVLQVAPAQPTGTAGVPSVRLTIRPWHAASSGAVERPAPQLNAAGGTYRVVPHEGFAIEMTATAIADGLRIVLTGRAGPPTLELRCEAGLCLLAAVLPRLVWRTPTLTIDVTVRPDGRAIAIRVVDIGGSIRPECPQGWLVERASCELLANMVAPEITRRTAALRSPSSDSASQWTFPIELPVAATVLAPARIEILELTPDATGVRVSFCITTDCADRLGRHPR